MSEQRELTGPDGVRKISELIKDIHIAMMTTSAPDGSLDTRPMAIQSTGFFGDLWFLTRLESGKVAEIEANPHVSLAFADTSNAVYVALKGRASISSVRSKIHELWNPMYKAWFPEGEEDPSIAVLRVEVSEGQYWEASSSAFIRGAKYLAAAATGGKVDLGDTGHVALR